MKNPAWWTILRISLEERLVYRGDFALGTLMRFLPIVTQIFLWWAIFDGLPSGTGPAEARIQNYAYPDFVAYFLLTMVGRAFSSMPGLASGVARQIRDGEIKKYLTQPVDFLSFLLLTRVAHKLAYYSVATLPFVLVFFVCRSFFVGGWPEPSVLAAFCVSLILSFLLGFFLEASLGLLAFWFLEISSLLFVYMLLNFFLSGHMFPLDMLPGPWKTAVDWLPLRYLAYFPAAVFLGKIRGDSLWWGMLGQVSWILFFFCLSRWAWYRGLRRYSGYGG